MKKRIPLNMSRNISFWKKTNTQYNRYRMYHPMLVFFFILNPRKKKLKNETKQTNDTLEMRPLSLYK